jgi:hypothetical protein
MYRRMTSTGVNNFWKIQQGALSGERILHLELERDSGWKEKYSFLGVYDKSKS